MSELVVSLRRRGHPIDVCAEDVPDCGPLQIAHDTSLWHDGQYAPEIVDGIAFCTSTDRTGGSMVSAVDLTTGTVKWETSTGGDSIGVSPNPVGDTVIAATDEGSIYCLRQSDGEILWLREQTSLQHDPIYSLAVNGSRVVFGTYDGDLSCLDAATGKHLWKVNHTEDLGRIKANPIVWRDSVIFCMWQASLLCLDMKNGQQRWRLECGGVGPGDDHMNPLLVSDLLFVPSYSEGICAVDLTRRQIAWVSKPDLCVCGRTPVVVGEVLYYRDDHSGILYGTPLRPSNTLFPKPLFVFQFGSGEELEDPDLAVHDGCLYCPSGQWLYVIEPRPAEGIPTEYHIRKYSAPDSFATGLAHDGDLFCAGMTTNKLVIGRLPDPSTPEESHSR